MDFSPPDSSVHGISQARVLERVAISSSKTFSSVQISRSVVSDSLWPHELQHARPPCPSPTPGVHSDSCPSSQWCHPAISSSAVPISSCPPIPPSIRVLSNESTLCNPMDCSTPGFPVHHQLPELAQTYFHWIGDAIQPSHPLSSSCPPVFNLSQHQDLFQWVSSAHQVPKYWSFSFSSSPPNEYLGLISYRIDWLNPLAVQEALFSNTQFKSINSYVLSFLYSPTLTSIHDY